MEMIFALESPLVALPVKEQEGLDAYAYGTRYSGMGAADGYAFCHYPFGSLERQNWLIGYAALAFSPEMLEKQMDEFEEPETIAT